MILMTQSRLWYSVVRETPLIGRPGHVSTLDLPSLDHVSMSVTRQTVEEKDLGINFKLKSVHPLRRNDSTKLFSIDGKVISSAGCISNIEGGKQEIKVTD
jgi:hypothetical protein